MSRTEGPVRREQLLEYFLQAAKPREQWQVGMEVERIARAADGGAPLAYAGTPPTVRQFLDYYRSARKCDPIWEADHLIGLDGTWGTITLEPGGQIEWSSRPQPDLDELRGQLDEHLAVLSDAADALGVRWVEAAVDPEHPVSAMPWMPKARYRIMRPFLGAQGKLAHRMMTQSASIQVAFDFSDPEDWVRKFRAGAFLAPVALALFANSSRIDGAESGFRSYRQMIWQETDPDRCGLPPVVFEENFSLESWLDWVLEVPTLFRHRARGLVPAGGVPFRKLMELGGCDAVKTEDWETHVSTIFTEVRSYTYIEIRSADLQPIPRMLAVPALWTGLLYHDDALTAALDLGAPFSSHRRWQEAMRLAARDGLDGTAGGQKLAALAAEMLSLAVDGLQGGAACAGRAAAVPVLEALATELELPVRF